MSDALEERLRQLSVAEKLTVLDEMEVSAHRHNDPELRRKIAEYRQRIREGKL